MDRKIRELQQKVANQAAKIAQLKETKGSLKAALEEKESLISNLTWLKIKYYSCASFNLGVLGFSAYVLYLLNNLSINVTHFHEHHYDTPMNVTQMSGTEAEDSTFTPLADVCTGLFSYILPACRKS